MYALFDSCSPAEAVVCPAFLKESTLFLFSPESVLRLSLSKYDAPQEAIDAKVEIQKCTDEMSFADKTIIAKILVISFLFYT